MNDRAVIALACQIAKLRDKARMWKQTALAYENEGMSARADAVTRAEQDRVRMEALRDELRREREAHAETADLLNKADAKVREWVTENQRLRNENAQAYEVVKERNQLLVEVAELRPLTRERDGFLTQVQDMRAEIERLKKPTRQHPVAVGEWVRRTTGSDSGRMAQVKSIAVLQYDVQIDGYKAFWASSNCDPCDPPATHDTEAGKAVAEAAVKTEPVADDIKVGDLVEVVSNRGRNTWLADVGSLGTVTSVEEINDSISVRLDDVPGKQNALAWYVSLCDVRKVTT